MLDRTHGAVCRVVIGANFMNRGFSFLLGAGLRERSGRWCLMRNRVWWLATAMALLVTGLFAINARADTPGPQTPTDSASALVLSTTDASDSATPADGSVPADGSAPTAAPSSTTTAAPSPAPDTGAAAAPPAVDTGAAAAAPVVDTGAAASPAPSTTPAAPASPTPDSPSASGSSGSTSTWSSNTDSQLGGAPAADQTGSGSANRGSSQPSAPVDSAGSLPTALASTPTPTSAQTSSQQGGTQPPTQTVSVANSQAPAPSSPVSPAPGPISSHPAASRYQAEVASIFRQLAALGSQLQVVTLLGPRLQTLIVRLESLTLIDPALSPLIARLQGALAEMQSGVRPVAEPLSSSRAAVDLMRPLLELPAADPLLPVGATVSPGALSSGSSSPQGSSGAIHKRTGRARTTHMSSLGSAPEASPFGARSPGGGASSASGGIGSSSAPAAVALLAVIVAWLLDTLLSGRIALDLVPRRATLLASRLERPG